MRPHRGVGGSAPRLRTLEVRALTVLAAALRCGPLSPPLQETT
jgi:hypothetical protein